MTEEKTSKEESQEGESKNHTEETEENQEEKTSKKESPKQPDKLKEAVAQKDHWKKKAQELQGEVKESGSKSDLSPIDTLALINAGVTHIDDVEEVVNYAKYKNMPIDKALKSSVVKTVLQENAEKRKTSQATNTGGGRRGTTKVSGKELLKRFEKTGELPESDGDMDRLAEARLQRQMEESKS